MRKIIQGLVLGVLLFGMAGSAMAADFATATGKDANVLVGASETHKNLYAVGGNVTVNGNTTGDLTAAGGSVTVSGDVEKDLLLAGGTLNLSGTIGANAKIAGGNIFITGPVKGDLAVAGGNINLTGKSSVDGDLLAAGGSITIDAPVKGNVKIAGGNVIINSKIDGSLDVKSGSLSFGSSLLILQQCRRGHNKGPLSARGPCYIGRFGTVMRQIWRRSMNSNRVQQAAQIGYFQRVRCAIRCAARRDWKVGVLCVRRHGPGGGGEHWFRAAGGLSSSPGGCARPE